MKFLKLFLILFLFSFVIVNAEILEVSTKGSVSGNKFVKQENDVNLEVIAKAGDGFLIPRQLGAVYRGQEFSFADCEHYTSENANTFEQDYIGYSKCSLTLNSIQKGDLDSEDLQIKLYSSDGSLIDTFPSKIYFDDFSPVIQSIVALGDELNNLTLVLGDNYCDGCVGGCSGLQKVVVKKSENDVINETMLDSSCSQTITLTFEEQTSDLDIEVYDVLENRGTDKYFWNPEPVLKDFRVTGEYGYDDGSFGRIRAFTSDDLFADKDVLNVSFLARKGSLQVIGNWFRLLVDGVEKNANFICQRLVNPPEGDVGFYNCTGLVNVDFSIYGQNENVICRVEFLKEDLVSVYSGVEDTANFKVDFEKPSISYEIHSRDSVNNYSVKVSASDNLDSASDNLDILKFRLYDGLSNLNSDNYFKEVMADDVSSVDNEYNITNITFDYDGCKDIYIQVYDNVGHVNNTMVELCYDTKKPATKGKFRLFSSEDYERGLEYKYLSLALTRSAHVYFEVEDESDFEILSVDASRLTRNPIKAREYKIYPVSDIDSCYRNKCIFNEPIDMLLDNLNGVYLNVTVNDSMGNSANLIFEPGFGIDLVDPEPESLQVGFCDATYGCFVGNVTNNPIKVEIAEEDSGFFNTYCFSRDNSNNCLVNGKNVKVDLSEWYDSSKEVVLSSCQKDGNWVCSGYFDATNDNDGNVLENVTKNSRLTSVIDDAGNRFRGDFLRFDSVGDRNLPSIESITVESLTRPVIAEGDLIKIISIIKDLSPVKMLLNVSHIMPNEERIISNDCDYFKENSTGRYWKCEWISTSSVVTPITGSNAYKANINLTFIDIVGHKTTVIDNTDIYLVDDSEGSWTGLSILNDEISPRYINRRLITVAPFILRVPYVINSLTSLSNLRIVSAEIPECEMPTDEGDSESFYFSGSFDDLYFLPNVIYENNLESSFVVADASSKFRMKRIMNENDRVNEIAWFNFSCDMHLYLAYDGEGSSKYVFDLPDVLDFNFSVDLRDTLNAPGEKIWEKIVELNETVSDMSWLYPTLTFMQTVQSICNLVNSLSNLISPLDNAAGAVLGVNALLEPLKYVPIVGGTIIPAVEGAADAITDFADGYRTMIKDWVGIPFNSADSGSLNKRGLIDTICNFVNCNHCDTQKNTCYPTAASFIEDKLPTFGDLLDATPAADDWRQSLITSIGCGCIPGIIMKFEESRQMKCRYMTCMRDKATQGLDVTSCEVDYQQEQCKQIMGEIQQLGFMRVLDAWFNSAPDLNQALMSLLNRRIEIVCESYRTGFEDLSAAAKFGSWTLCALPSGITTWSQTIARTQSFMEDPTGNIMNSIGNYVNSWGGLKSAFSYNNDECSEWVEAPRLGIPQETLDANLIGE